MKIIKNTSSFDNKKLQSLFSLIHNQIAKYEGRLKHWKTLKVQIRNKSYGYSGRAYLGKVYGSGWDMFLSVSNDLSLEKLSQLFGHELMHSYGYKHSAFCKDPLTKKNIDEIKEKFSNINLHKVIKEKPKKDIIVSRYDNIVKNYNNWEKKYLYSMKKLKKYKKEKRKYELRHKDRLITKES